MYSFEGKSYLIFKSCYIISDWLVKYTGSHFVYIANNLLIFHAPRREDITKFSADEVSGNGYVLFIIY